MARQEALACRKARHHLRTASFGAPSPFYAEGERAKPGCGKRIAASLMLAYPSASCPDLFRAPNRAVWRLQSGRFLRFTIGWPGQARP